MNLVMASVLLVMLLVFWHELATGAASCFGGISAAEKAGEETGASQPDAAEEETPAPAIRVKSVPRESL